LAGVLPASVWACWSTGSVETVAAGALTVLGALNGVPEIRFAMNPPLENFDFRFSFERLQGLPGKDSELNHLNQVDGQKS
jgi:hypothetical protein